jgi:hypothetical protein
MEEGREGEQQQAGGGSQEKGLLERSEKEELKEEPLRRTRTLERQVRGPHPSPITHSVANWPKIRPHLTEKGPLKKWSGRTILRVNFGWFSTETAELSLESLFSTPILCYSRYPVSSKGKITGGPNFSSKLAGKVF